MICGGAALTRKYVEDDLRREYSSAVFYADDAFAGLHLMKDLCSADGQREERLAEGRKVKEIAKKAAASVSGDDRENVARSVAVAEMVEIPSRRSSACA